MPTPATPAARNNLQLGALTACLECDLLLSKPVLRKKEKAHCPRCDHELCADRPDVVDRSLALVLTALLLYIPANCLPIMQLHLLGQTSSDTVWNGVTGLFNTGMHGVAVVVFLCSMAIPLLKLTLQLVVLASLRLNTRKKHAVACYRAYQHLREWGMLEVYFMGILVAIVKLVDLAELTLGVGLFFFISLLFIQVWLEIEMSPQQIWSILSEENEHARD